MNIISKQLQDLITWTQSPDPGQFDELVATLTDGDLMVAMTYMKTEPVAHVAWAEFGRRAGFFDLKLTAVESEGKLSLNYTGEAKSVHHGAFKVIA